MLLPSFFPPPLDMIINIYKSLRHLFVWLLLSMNHSETRTFSEKDTGEKSNVGEEQFLSKRYYSFKKTNEFNVLTVPLE